MNAATANTAPSTPPTGRPVAPKGPLHPSCAHHPLAKPVASPKPSPAVPAARDERLVNVANFHGLPLSGAPLVSARVDPTLGTLGPIPLAIDRLERSGAAGSTAAGVIRIGSRLIGPGLQAASAVRDVRMMPKVWRDKTIARSSKVVFTGITASAIAQTGAAAVAALPARMAGAVGIGQAGQVVAAKVCGLLGGASSLVFSGINLRETLHNPQATHAERFFSKAIFGVTITGTLLGGTAMLLSLPFAAPLMASAPAVVPLATSLATGTFFIGLGCWFGQLGLRKNAWLNQHLAHSPLG